MGHKDDEDKKKIGGISSSGSTKGIKAAESVGGVDKVKETSAVKSIAGIAGVGKSGALGNISLEQRTKLLSIVSEETEKLIAQGVIPKSQRDVVEQAVKMVIDASLIENNESKAKK
jgi:hypothetical protein